MPSGLRAPLNQENSVPITHMTKHTVNATLMTVMKSPKVSGVMLSVEPRITEMQHMATPMLTVIPICLIIEIDPEAMFLSLKPTADIAADVFGAENSP